LIGPEKLVDQVAFFEGRLRRERRRR